LKTSRNEQYQNEAHAATTIPVLGLAMTSNACSIAIDAVSKPSRKQLVKVAVGLVAMNALTSSQIKAGKVKKGSGSTAMLVNSVLAASLVSSAGALKYDAKDTA